MSKRLLALFPIGLVILGALLAFPGWLPAPITGQWLNPVPGYSFPTAPALTGWSDPRLTMQTNEPLLTFAHRAMESVHWATYHCEYTATAQSLPAALAVAMTPASERTMLSQTGYLDPSALRCGYCHQRAFVLAGALRRAGVADARVRSLNGHVITRFSWQGTQYAIDADRGVGPFSYDRSHVNAALVRAVYWDVPFVGQEREELVAAYANAADNVDYFTQDTLQQEADRQAASVRKATILLNALGLFLLVLASGLAVLLAMRQKHEPTVVQISKAA